MILRPPTIDENLWTEHVLFRRYRYTRGLTLLVRGTSVTVTEFPAQEDLAEFDRVYLGGHEYPITDAEATILEAAGWGDYISEE